MNAPTSGRRSGLALAVVGTILGLVAIGLVVRELVEEWGPTSEAIADASVPWLVAAVVLGTSAMVLMAVVWADVLAALGAPRPRGQVLRWYFLGELGKYLPGGVWTVVGRGELARRAGVPAPAAYGSVGLSLLLLYLSAAVAAAGLVPFDLAADRGDARLVAALAVVIAGGIAVVHPATVTALLGLARRATGRTLALQPLPAAASLRLVARYLPSWAAVGAATWAVARSLDPDASLVRVALAAIVSWIVGLLAVPVPAGGGVREATFLALAGLPAGIGAATALAARLLFVAVDAGGAVVATITARRRMFTAPAEAD